MTTRGRPRSELRKRVDAMALGDELEAAPNASREAQRRVSNMLLACRRSRADGATWTMNTTEGAIWVRRVK